MPDELIDSMSLVGTPEECRERIQTYRDAGITLPIVMPSVDRERAVEQAKETGLAARADESRDEEG